MVGVVITRISVLFLTSAMAVRDIQTFDLALTKSVLQLLNYGCLLKCLFK